jgi:hypothetical protein
VNAAAAYALLEKDARFMRFSSTARALCAVAWADGAPLRPGTVAGDLEVLVVAELYVHHGADAGEALARARGEPIEDAVLRGTVRYASSRLAEDHLGPELEGRGVRSVRELDRASLAELASSLFVLPADEPDEQATIAAALVLCQPAYQDEGPVLGGCLRCGEPAFEGGPSIAVRYRVRRQPGSKEPSYEWKIFSPLVELGAYLDEATRKRRRQRPPEVVRQARAGAHLLCRSCTAEARFGLVAWPAPPEEELGEEDEPIDPDVEVADVDAATLARWQLWAEEPS